jgi:hypothetical protein
MRCRGKEKQKAAGWLEPAGEWAEHSAVQRQEGHVPHYRATKSIFYPITRTSFWVRMPNFTCNLTYFYLTICPQFTKCSIE